MEPSAGRLKALQSEVERLTHYLTALPPDAWNHPSACARWQVADVVAHLAAQALYNVDRLSRGLHGDTTPPEGWLPVSTHDEEAFAEGMAQRAIAERIRLGDQLLTTFIVGNDALHQLLTGLAPQDWEALCYHPAGLVTVRTMVDMRLTELAMHGWDIRSQLDPIAHLAPESFSALLGTIPRAVRRAFRPDPSRAHPIRYRFCVTAPITTTTDIVLSREGARVEPAGEAIADVLFRCATETYVLIVFGRCPLEGAMAAGKVVVEGDQALASVFGQSFKGG